MHSGEGPDDRPLLDLSYIRGACLLEQGQETSWTEWAGTFPRGGRP